MPAQNTSKCGLQNLLDALLSVALQEQNLQIPPSIFTSWVNTITSLLISSLVKVYPENPGVVDMLDSFVEFQMIPVSGGYFNLPVDYRDILGSPYIFANPKSNGECGDIPPVTNAQQFLALGLKASCNIVPLEIVPQSEFSIRTSSTYKFPTYDLPVGFFAGKKQVKICPYDLSKIALLYTRNEKVCNMSYIMQPDDTYIIDPTNPNFVDTELNSNCFEPVFKALISLYSAYSRDNELRDWARILHSEGIL